MSVVASGPPFVSRDLCKCGWMWADECKKTEGCGLKNGMPEYEQRATLHTPYEFLSESAKEAAVNVVRDMIEEKKTLRDLVGDEEWSHYKVLPDGSFEDQGTSRPEWDSNGLPKFTGWENTDPVTYLGAREPSTHQIGGTHYAEMEVQPWDAMRAWMSPSEYAAYHIGTVIGYLARHKKKGGLQDIKKAHHHLSELIRYFEEEEEYPW